MSGRPLHNIVVPALSCDIAVGPTFCKIWTFSSVFFVSQTISFKSIYIAGVTRVWLNNQGLSLGLLNSRWSLSRSDSFYRLFFENSRKIDGNTHFLIKKKKNIKEVRGPCNSQWGRRGPNSMVFDARQYHHSRFLRWTPEQSGLFLIFSSSLKIPAPVAELYKAIILWLFEVYCKRTDCLCVRVITACFHQPRGQRRKDPESKRWLTDW